jgi:hypothetical protein
MHIGNMIRTLLFVPLLLVALAGPICALELEEIKSSDQLARFIYEMVKEEVPAGRLLNGIRSPEILRIPGYEVEIPVREIFGTIVAERFADKLNRQLFDNGKKYDVRAICAFRDSKDNVWRFHITVFEERQYKLMEQFLERIMKE